MNVSNSNSKINSHEEVYENGNFINVNEIHNNTKNMKLSGFNQENGSVLGNIENLELETLQNTSRTKGDTKSISLGVNLLAGIPSGSISANKTKGDRNFADNQTTFVAGKDSNLKIENVDNTASIIGTTDDGKITIKNYTGKNLENSEKLKTVGGSVGTSGIGINYSNSEKERITRNTVVGNVEIVNTNNSDINYDITKANEITKDSSTKTDVYAESQLIDAVQNPDKFKEKIEVAKIEVDSLKNSVTKTIDNILNGDKSQDISKAERRQLEEIKEIIIRVQTANEIRIIAEEDFTKPEVQNELKVTIEKFNSDDPNLSEAVKIRIEELAKNGEEIIAFYDKSTGKIFINENAPENKVRPAIAREWKIKEELEANKGILNAEGKQRATVAGEIAYSEILGRTEKKPADKLNINNLANAKMNPDSEVTADLIDKETEAQYFNSLKYVNSLGDGSKKINPEVLKEMRGDTGYITDFTSRPNYTIKTIHKKYAESEDGTRKIKIAKETVDKLNKEYLNREYYVRVDGIKKEVVIESVPKTNPYTYHLKKTFLSPFEKGLFEYSYDSFQYFIDGKYRKSVEEINSAIGGITEPLTLGVGRKLGDEAGRVEAGSIQYGSKEDITEKVEILRDSGRFTGDFIVSSITAPLLMKGISKGKEFINGFTQKNSIINNSDTTRVGRWMSEAEYKKMIETGKVQMSDGGITHVANPADINAFRSAKKGSIYVEFDVKTSAINPGGKKEWGIIAGPNSTYDKLNRRKGLPGIEKMPDAFNIEMKGKK